MDISSILQANGGKLTGSAGSTTAKSASQITQILQANGGKLSGGSAPQGNNQPSVFSSQGIKTGAPIKAVADALGTAAGDTANALSGNSGTPLDYINPLGWINKGVGALAGLGANMVSDVAKKGLPFLPGTSAPAIGTDLRNLVGGQNVDKAVNSPTRQKVLGGINKATDFVQKDPEIQSGVKDIGGAVNLGMTMAAIGSVAPELGKVGSMVAQELGPKYVESAKADWAKPSQTPQFKAAKDVIANAKGTDIPETIVKNGTKLSDNVDSGKYATRETAQQYRDDAGKASREIIRPALQTADESPNAPKIQVNDIVKQTIIDIQKSNATADDMEAQIQAAKDKGAALERRYPNGMKLTDMHDEKIRYTSNRYSPVGPKSDTNAAEVDRAFGRTLGASVVENAPPGVKEFVTEANRELSGQYKAADYLDALDNKKVPISMAAKARNYAGKIIGVGVANNALPGVGGILADVAGYHIGGMVETMLENMSSPFKDTALSNLQSTNPEAFTALKKYVSSGGTPTFALPAGDPNAGPNQAVFPFIQGRAPTQFDPQAPMNNYSK